jgi:methionine salvage enolase-phosphatase E1
MSTESTERKRRKVADFVKDGMETADIKAMVQDIVLYMTENKAKHSSHAELLNEMKKSIEGILFFEERYPMLYAMVTKEEGFEYSSLEYFLEMREKIVNNQLTSEQASKVVGQVWFDKYYKKPDGEK